MLPRRSVLAGLTFSIACPLTLRAQTAPVFYSAKGAAITGYDAVSYFRDGGPVQGQPDIAVMWKGATWRFASQENREAFELNPRAYAPRFGGYCAYAMAYGELTSTDPMAWKIVGGRLYLTHSLEIEKMWLTDTTGFIQKAEKNWPAILYG